MKSFRIVVVVFLKGRDGDSNGSGSVHR